MVKFETNLEPWTWSPRGSVSVDMKWSGSRRWTRILIVSTLRFLSGMAYDHTTFCPGAVTITVQQLLLQIIASTFLMVDEVGGLLFLLYFSYI